MDSKNERVQPNAPGTFQLNTSVSMKIDEYGNPVLTGSTPSYVGSLLSAGAYFIRRLFSSKDEEAETEDSVIVRLTAFLKRLQVRLEFDPNTGQPVISVGIEETPVEHYTPSGLGRKCKKRLGHKMATHKRKARLRKYSKRKGGLPVVDKPIVAYGPSVNETAKAPYVVESQQGRVVYQIQNVNVYITADLVTNMYVNPKNIINVIQDQLRAELDKIEKTEIKPET